LPSDEPPVEESHADHIHTIGLDLSANRLVIAGGAVCRCLLKEGRSTEEYARTSGRGDVDLWVIADSDAEAQKVFDRVSEHFLQKARAAASSPSPDPVLVVVRAWCSVTSKLLRVAATAHPADPSAALLRRPGDPRLRRGRLPGGLRRGSRSSDARGRPSLTTQDQYTRPGALIRRLRDVGSVATRPT
jgi:hypothetical protein